MNHCLLTAVTDTVLQTCQCRTRIELCNGEQWKQVYLGTGYSEWDEGSSVSVTVFVCSGRRNREKMRDEMMRWSAPRPQRERCSMVLNGDIFTPSLAPTSTGAQRDSHTASCLEKVSWLHLIAAILDLHYVFLYFVEFVTCVANRYGMATFS